MLQQQLPHRAMHYGTACKAFKQRQDQTNLAGIRLPRCRHRHGAFLLLKEVCGAWLGARLKPCINGIALNDGWLARLRKHDSVPVSGLDVLDRLPKDDLHIAAHGGKEQPAAG